MKVKEIAKILDADLFCNENDNDADVHYAFASDMMSDVLAYAKEQDILISGLCNPQTIRTAIMLDIKCVILVRGKTPTKDMIDLAKSNGIVLMSSKLKLYPACIELYKNGILPGDYSI